MRGDLIHRVYGVHEGRAADSFFGAFRSMAEAEAHVAVLEAKEMNGRSWAAQYHDKGFVVREVMVETDFEIPPRPGPRDRYFVRTSPRPNRPGTWDSTHVDVFRRDVPADQVVKVCDYERDYALLQTFEPFRQGERELALISRDYTRTAVLDLSTGHVIAEEEETSGEFCPVGFFVPDWWDVHDGSIIPGSEYWNEDREWPTGDFGFVWGCHWGDDSSWKVQHLDLSRVLQGVIRRDERFGYVELATRGPASPALEPERAPGASAFPSFIRVSRRGGISKVEFAVEMRFDLASGNPADWKRVTDPFE